MNELIAYPPGMRYMRHTYIGIATKVGISFRSIPSEALNPITMGQCRVLGSRYWLKPALVLINGGMKRITREIRYDGTDALISGR